MTALDSSQWMYNPSTSFYPFTIEQSLVFNPSHYTARTPSSAGNRAKYTVSVWVKRHTVSSNFHPILGAATESGGNQRAWIYFQSDDRFSWSLGNTSNSVGYEYTTTAVFRDISAWYHVLCVLDTSRSNEYNSTEGTNRIEIYVNGALQTLTRARSALPSGYSDGRINSTVIHYHGRTQYVTDTHLSMAEFHLLDGSAALKAEFGEYKSGIWVAKEYTSGNYGTNGVYFKYNNVSNFGEDLSGNGNDYSVNTLASNDQRIDSPTNNHSTFNPLEAESLLTYSEGNLALAYSGNTNRALARSTIKMPASTDAFFEVKITSGLGGGVDMAIGIEDGTAQSANDAVVFANAFIIREDGTFYDQNSSGSYGVSFTNNDVIGVWRKANGDLLFYKNGTAMNSGTPAKTGLTGEFHFVAGPFNGASCIARFASNEWTNAPSGVDDTMSLCAANLPDPAIDPAQNEEPADHFNTVLYTGNGSSRSITGVGFSPDWIWFKARSGAIAHLLYDSVRGATKYLQSNSTSAEGTESNSQTSFDSDGFSLGSDSTTGVNQNSTTYVAWNWLAGGSASSNSDGGITSSVSANTEAGFSIVSYTGTGSITTVGHGLNSAPEMIIIKNRNGTQQWVTYVEGASSTAGSYLLLNKTDAVATDDANFNNVNPTSSVFTVTDADGDTGRSGSTYIAYCFHSVDGYSKIGTYTGNGSSDGTFVFTGLRPSFLLIKRTDSTGSWYIMDNKRNPFNEVNNHLYPNLAQAEAASSHDTDFLSNGFKARGSAADLNASGGTYVYLAIAEQPAKYSNAR